MLDGESSVGAAPVVVKLQGKDHADVSEPLLFVALALQKYVVPIKRELVGVTELLLDDLLQSAGELNMTVVSHSNMYWPAPVNGSTFSIVVRLLLVAPSAGLLSVTVEQVVKLRTSDHEEVS